MNNKILRDVDQSLKDRINDCWRRPLEASSTYTNCMNVLPGSHNDQKVPPSSNESLRIYLCTFTQHMFLACCFYISFFYNLL